MKRKREWACVVWLVVITLGGCAEDGDGLPPDQEYLNAAPDSLEIIHYSEDTDYIYDGEFDSTFSPQISNVTLHKCQCAGNQAWKEGECQNASTEVFILEQYSGQWAPVNTSDLKEVKVEPLTCQPHLRPVRLNPNKSYQHEFFILESGDLYWQQKVFTSSQYCIDHILDSVGQPGTWTAEVCLAPPSLPLCCPPMHVLLHGKCTPTSTAPVLRPLVTVLEQPIMWPNAADGSVVPVTCVEGEVLQREVEGNVSLVWHFQGPLLYWLSPSVRGHLEPSHEYCLGVEESGKTVAQVCYRDPVAEHQRVCNNVTCVRKCCPQNHQFHGTCTWVTDSDEQWHLEFHEIGSLTPAPPPSDVTIIEGFPLCQSVFVMESHEPYHLLTDGSLHIETRTSPLLVPPDRYCLENFQVGKDLHVLPVVCFQEDHCKEVEEHAYPALLAVSCVFMAITLLVYVSIPELHATLHGKCLVSHVTALLLAYLSLIINQRTTGRLPRLACTIIASVMHLTFLAAFFWLNVMCFDIWWTVISMCPVAESGEQSRLRFRMYSLYSWGSPALITLAGVIIQSLPDHYHLIRPNVGHDKCWFDNNESLWAYFYGPVLAVVVCNIVFFCWVAAYLLTVAQTDPVLQRTCQHNRKRMWLTVKLFVVMGLTWITEVISWQEGSCQAWIPTDVINALQGFSIFILYICKKNIIKRVRTNWDSYLRRVKQVLGPASFPTPISRATHDNTSSLSSSIRRPTQSTESQPTLHTHLTTDPVSFSSKLSCTSLGSLTCGIPLQSTNSFCMNTITEHAANSMTEDTPNSFSINSINEDASDSLCMHTISKHTPNTINKDTNDSTTEDTANSLCNNSISKDTPNTTSVDASHSISKDTANSLCKNTISEDTVNEDTEDLELEQGHGNGTGPDEAQKKKCAIERKAFSENTRKSQSQGQGLGQLHEQQIQKESQKDDTLTIQDLPSIPGDIEALDDDKNNSQGQKNGLEQSHEE